MTQTAKERADELFELAKAQSDADDQQAALALYLESLALNRDQPNALYNVGRFSEIRVNDLLGWQP